MAMDALHELGNALTQRIQTDKTHRDKILEIRLDAQFFKNEYRDYIDACHLANLLIERLTEEEDQEIIKKANIFIKSMKACIIQHETGPLLEKATGLSIWFPTSESKYWDHLITYQDLIGIKKSDEGWLSFLRCFHHGYKSL